MTSATIKPARSGGGGYAVGRGLGLVVFAAVMVARARHGLSDVRNDREPGRRARREARTMICAL